MSFEIVTDSVSNISAEDMKRHNIKVISLAYFVDGKEYCGYDNWLKQDFKEYFRMVKEKHQMTTSLPPYEEYAPVFTELAQQGEDILFIACSSGISGTYQTISRFLRELSEKYPAQKILSIDSLCISCGEGLMVDCAIQLRSVGKNIEEVRNRLEEYKLKVRHEFFVDDLFYLKRGGRISVTTAFAGSILQIKPILHVDNKGAPIIVSKIRGRKSATAALLENFGNKYEKSDFRRVYVCHAGCPEDAEELAQKIRKKFFINDVVVRYSEPIIGLHTGTGALGIFYVGSER